MPFTNNDEDIIPLVSISCITYNHENYIRDTIEGFLMQKTNFNFEVLIHDDASTDYTAEIIREYEKKYPDIIKPIYQKENQYSKGVKISPKIQYPRAKGKYIAGCEGDDYWTDSYKLQKQVDFLEANPEYGMVHTDADQYYTQKKLLIKNYNCFKQKVIYEEDVYENILRSKYPIFTCTTMYRSELLRHIEFDEMKKFKMGDTFLWLEIARRSKIKYFDESMAVRNLLEESATQSKDINKILDFKISGYKLFKHFICKYGCSKETEIIVHSNSIKVILITALKAARFDVVKEYAPLGKKYKVHFTLKQKLSLCKSLFISLLKKS